MKYNKNELEDLILIQKISYKEIGRRYGVSDTFIRKKSKNLGIELPKRKNFIKKIIPHNKGKFIRLDQCLNCKERIKTDWYSERKFCSRDCSKEYKIQEKWNHYLSNQQEYCKITNLRFVKKHLLYEQKSCCKICNLPNQWNKKILVFILDHIDGDASNNLRINLRLICPNCDSQLDTFKSKNKNSSRKDRYIKNYKIQ